MTQATTPSVVQRVPGVEPPKAGVLGLALAGDPPTGDAGNGDATGEFTGGELGEAGLPGGSTYAGLAMVTVGGTEGSSGSAGLGTWSVLGTAGNAGATGLELVGGFAPAGEAGVAGVTGFWPTGF